MINFCRGCGSWFTHKVDEDYCDECFHALLAEEQLEKERRMSVQEQLKYFKEWLDRNPDKVRELRNSVTIAQTLYENNTCEPKCECMLHSERFRGILGHS